jgi:alkylation response protein AidB-like acyl-CoA dehydrogenase
MVEGELEPRFTEWFEAESAHELIREYIKKLGDEGYLRMIAPEVLGGYGLRLTNLMILLEELARTSGGLAIQACANSMFGLAMAQISPAFAKWGEQLMAGDMLAAVAENSPEGQCNHNEIAEIAKLEGDEWVLNGVKAYSSGGTFCDVLMVTGLYEGDRYRWAMDPRNTPGLRIISNPEFCCTPEYATVELSNVRVPKEFGTKTGDIINREPVQTVQGKVMLTTLVAMAFGCMTGAFDKTVEYLKNRTTDFKPIASLGSMQYKLALMKTRIEACRSFMLIATQMVETNHRDALIYGNMVKQFICDTARDITSECVQMYGCLGCNPLTGIERHLRDATGFGIGASTSELHLANVAKYMGLPNAEWGTTF